MQFRKTRKLKKGEKTNQYIPVLGSLDYKYYSFIIGHADSPMENWIKLDVKQPAQTPKEAIYLHYLSSWMLIYTKKWGFTDFQKRHEMPSRYYVRTFYRAVLEYSKKPVQKYGPGRVEYKFEKRYWNKEFAPFFPNT